MYRAVDFFGKDALTLFHGSRVVVKQPWLGGGSSHCDYRSGFYGTESLALASEWACPTLDDGCVNEYRLSLGGLKVLDLSSPEFSVLNWLAVLLAHRTFEVEPSSSRRARDFMLERYGVDLTGADLIHGYRADDSYFSFARDFLTNQIDIETLERALFSGGLGYQIALKTESAFEALSFVGSATVEGSRWNPLRIARDGKAREQYQRLRMAAIEGGFRGTYLMDLMRGEA